jgi:hypothetical protein
VIGSIVDARKKAELLNVIASQEGIAREQVRCADCVCSLTCGDR